jgi:hypothetical protein
LQLQEKTDEKQNAAQIKELARKLLELHNRHEQQHALSALDLPGLRAGAVVYVDLPETGVEQMLLVEEVSHDLVNETMEVTVQMVVASEQQ